jgi:peptide/nickel transport system substrate-binding protein
MREDTLVMIQDDLRKIGIVVTPEMREWSVFLDDIKAKRFDACHLAWQTDFVFNPYDIFHSDAIDGKYNMTSFSNPAVDSLMDAATLAPTPELARPLWREMLGILHREQPYTILYELVYSTGVSSRIQGVEMDVRSYLVGIRDWWIAPADRKYAS